MDQDVESAGVDAAVAPGSGVDLRLEEGEVEALHVALAAGVAERLEIGRVGPLILVRKLLGEVVLAATATSPAAAAAAASSSAASGRQCHFRWNTPLPFPWRETAIPSSSSTSSCCLFSSFRRAVPA